MTLSSPRPSPHGALVAHNEQRCGVLPCVGKRGEGSSQGGSTRSRARRAARKARGVGGAVQAARRAEPSMRAAQWVRGGTLQRLVVLAVRGPGEPNAPGLADSARAFLSLAILIGPRGTRGTWCRPTRYVVLSRYTYVPPYGRRQPAAADSKATAGLRSQSGTSFTLCLAVLCCHLFVSRPPTRAKWLRTDYADDRLMFDLHVWNDLSLSWD